MTFEECIEQVNNAKYGSDIRAALVGALKHINSAINVDRPKNCPNCGAAITGRNANCEYCGTLIIWR